MKPGTPKPPCCGGGFVVIVINQIPAPRTIGHRALFVVGGCTVVVDIFAVSGNRGISMHLELCGWLYASGCFMPLA